jgi:hypothetical protein
MADSPDVGLIDEYDAAHILLELRYSDRNPSHSHRQQFIDNGGEVTLYGNDEQTVGTNAATSSDNFDETFNCPHCGKLYNANKSLAVSCPFTWARLY